ncbi:uncharacterized protein Tco025E_08285, partial [Trypanosoma conorhini]
MNKTRWDRNTHVLDERLQIHSPSCAQPRAVVPHSPSRARSNSRDTHPRRVPSLFPSPGFTPVMFLKAAELLSGREVPGVPLAGFRSAPPSGAGLPPGPAAAPGASAVPAFGGKAAEAPTRRR